MGMIFSKMACARLMAAILAILLAGATFAAEP
jgi:hypothetical protein